MMTLSCLCGQVRVQIDKRPDHINACNCLLCSKSGARWAYFAPSEARVAGATTRYCRADKDDPVAEIHFCPTCGSTTHFTLTASAAAKFGNSLIGVNMWLAGEQALAGIELRFPDGRAWSGAGDFAYVRAPRILGQTAMTE